MTSNAWKFPSILSSLQLLFNIVSIKKDLKIVSFLLDTIEKIEISDSLTIESGLVTRKTLKASLDRTSFAVKAPTFPSEAEDEAWLLTLRGKILTLLFFVKQVGLENCVTEEIQEYVGLRTGRNEGIKTWLDELQNFLRIKRIDLEVDNDFGELLMNGIMLFATVGFPILLTLFAQILSKAFNWQISGKIFGVEL